MSRPFIGSPSTVRRTKIITVFYSFSLSLSISLTFPFFIFSKQF